MSAFATLFFTSFIAATFFPAQSEALLAWLISSGEYAPWALVAVASVGNTLGALFNWWLGTLIEHFKNRPWFPVNEANLTRAQAWYEKYGRWSLLLSWVPFIGDPITFAAGIMRERFLIFLTLVGIAKTARYILISFAV